eukprot:g620.t1
MSKETIAAAQAEINALLEGLSFVLDSSLKDSKDNRNIIDSIGEDFNDAKRVFSGSEKVLRKVDEEEKAFHFFLNQLDIKKKQILENVQRDCCIYQEKLDAVSDRLDELQDAEAELIRHREGRLVSIANSYVLLESKLEAIGKAKIKKIIRQQAVENDDARAEGVASKKKDNIDAGKSEDRLSEEDTFFYEDGGDMLPAPLYFDTAVPLLFKESSMSRLRHLKLFLDFEAEKRELSQSIKAEGSSRFDDMQVPAANITAQRRPAWK